MYEREWIKRIWEKEKLEVNEKTEAGETTLYTQTEETRTSNEVSKASRFNFHPCFFFMDFPLARPSKLRFLREAFPADLEN